MRGACGKVMRKLSCEATVYMYLQWTHCASRRFRTCLRWKPCFLEPTCLYPEKRVLGCLGHAYAVGVQCEEFVVLEAVHGRMNKIYIFARACVLHGLSPKGVAASH